MALKHAKPGEVVALSTYGPDKTDTRTVALVKTDKMEIVRLFTPAGGTVAPHKVSGPITVQCIRGEADFLVDGKPCAMRAGDWLHLEGGRMHAIEAHSDCVLLLTIVFVEGDRS